VSAIHDPPPIQVQNARLHLLRHKRHPTRRQRLDPHRSPRPNLRLQSLNPGAVRNPAERLQKLSRSLRRRVRRIGAT